MSKEKKDEKINLDSLIKNYRVNDIDSFEAYLKDVWTDLCSRVTQNKNDAKEKVVRNGLSKVVFNSYYTLPGIIGDRLFKVFDTNCNDSIEILEFVEGMRTLFYEDYEKTSRFIFDFYDFDHDERITQEDIRVVLSYITLTHSDSSGSEKKIAETNDLSYKNRLSSQEELVNILNTCFTDKHIKKSLIDYKDFKYIIENINSDIYLMIFLFLLEKKPFTNKNIQSYEHHSKNSSRKSSPSKGKKLLASPTKNANFSPYRRFQRVSSLKNIKKQSTNILNTDMGEPSSKEMGCSMSPIIGKIPRKKNTQKIKRGIIQLQPLADEEKIICSGFKNVKNKKDEQVKEKEKEDIDLKRVDELTTVRKRDNLHIRDSDSPLKPAFKQSKKVGKNIKKEKRKNDNNIEFVDNEEEKEKNDDDDDDEDDDNNEEKDSSSDSSFEGVDIEKDDEGLNYQGKLYKYVKDKFKELWFKLIYKDLYYYKNKNEKVHRGMHNLSGLFFKGEGLQEIGGRKMYCFSISFPSKNRVYYCDNENDYNNWVKVLKKATGYTNLLDIYDIKQKLGKGKFGLVKLGINKETKQKVAVKIMNKNNMDSSDLELVRTEIEILKICQHPYIIKLYDVFENIDYIYIIMEYCSGGDLFSFIQKRNYMLKEEKVVVIMYKLCKAVYYVHSYGIAHRDIKPENVLLTSESEDADIRLLDFGLSKIVGPNQKCTEPYGTLTYCAPEIILDKPYLKTVDSWSLGVMTYLMLSGSLPFSGKNEHEIAKNVVYSKVDFERKPIWKEITNEAKDFITKLLEKDLKKRIEIKTALEHPWFKKFKLQNEIDDNNVQVNKNIKKANSIQNDFGIYTSALKK
jgi:hypothetical protein